MMGDVQQEAPSLPFMRTGQFLELCAGCHARDDALGLNAPVEPHDLLLRVLQNLQIPGHCELGATI